MLKLILRCTAGISCFIGFAGHAQLTITYDYTGDVQTYTVPTGVTTIEIEAWGAQGQALTIEDYDGTTGGLGGYATGLLNVTPGEVLNIYVGGTGADDVPGFNGGGLGGYGTPSTGGGGRAGSGGGASDIRQGGDALADRVIVAGGGGGGGRDYVNGSCVPCGMGGNGGAGGAIIGVDGEDPTDPIYGTYFNPGAGGSGGTDMAGGAGGDGTEGTDGNPGELGIGGNGINGSQSVASGGGGGGYYGGGAGAGASSGSGAAGGGGAGGSSYLGTLTDASTEAGIREGNGQIIITEVCIGLITEISALEICEGEELILYAESTLDGTIIWDDPDVTNGEPFIPEETGVVTYTATSDDDGDCAFSVDITILEGPDVAGMASESTICEGEELTLTGSGADTYIWDNGAEDGVAYVPDVGTGLVEFKVIGTTAEFGCTDSAIVEVTINEKPVVVAMSDEESYCEGDLVTLTGSGADSYTWDMGVIDGEPFEQEVGTVSYIVVGVSSGGCEDQDTIDVTITPNPSFTITTTDELWGSDGTAVLVIDLGMAPFTFDWDNDETGDFDDDQSQFELEGGTYTVTMIDATGCSATATITIGSQLSLDEPSQLEITVYPNPTLNEITIVHANAYRFKLNALNGQLITSGNAVDQNMLSLKDLPSGTYLLEIVPENGERIITQIIKQ